MLSSDSNLVEMKPLLESDFQAVSEKELLQNGDRIKLSESSLVTVQFRGAEFKFQGPAEFDFNWASGSGLVESSAEIHLISGEMSYFSPYPFSIQTNVARIDLDSSVGRYKKTEGRHQVASGYGITEVFLKTPKIDRSFILPAKHQIQFTDSQLSSDYEKLEYSKLKKELRLRKNNQELNKALNPFTQKLVGLSKSSNYIPEKNYRLKDIFYNSMVKFVFLPDQKSQLLQKKLMNHFNFIALNIENGNSSIPPQIISKINDDIAYISLNERRALLKSFYDLNLSPEVRTYFLKEFMPILLSDSYFTPDNYRAYLLNLNKSLEKNDLIESKKLVKGWLGSWNKNLIKTNTNEWQLQKRIYHHLLLAYADRIDLDLIYFLDSDENKQKIALQFDLLESIQERLELARALLEAKRYSDAKAYIRKSYDQDFANTISNQVAARDLFFKESLLIADQIDYEISLLKSSAPEKPISFQEYLDSKKLTKEVEKRFQESFVKNNVAKHQGFPDKKETIDLLAEYGFVILEENILFNELTHQYEIRKATLNNLKDSTDSKEIIAVYNPELKAFSEIYYDQKDIKGGVRLADVQVIFFDVASEDLVAEGDLVLPFLKNIEETPSSRNQLVNQDLTINLTKKNLENSGLKLISNTEINLVSDNLNQFKVSSVVVEGGEGKLDFLIEFLYSLKTNEAKEIEIIGNSGFKINRSIKLDQVKDQVLKEVDLKAKKETLVEQLVVDLRKFDLNLSSEDIAFNDLLTKADLSNLQYNPYSIVFSATYDLKNKVFLSATHPLLEAGEVSIESFLENLFEAWFLNHMKENEILLSKDQIKTELPASLINIENYTQGDRIFSFKIDLAEQKVRDLKISGVSGVVKELGFKDLSQIR